MLHGPAVLWRNGNQGTFYSMKSTGSLTRLGDKADAVPDFGLMETWRSTADEQLQGAKYKTNQDGPSLFQSLTKGCDLLLCRSTGLCLQWGVQFKNRELF